MERYQPLPGAGLSLSDISEIREQETPQQLWDAHYTAITVCNEVLKHVAGASNKDAYASQVAEAKLCRAYSMFQLANVFCQAYAPENGSLRLWPALSYRA